MKYCLCLLALALVSCTTSMKHRDPAAMTEEEFTSDTSPLPPTELGEVWDQHNVDQANETVAMFEGMLKNETHKGEFFHRDAHPKHHACVKSTLTIDPSRLPQDERVGLYSQPGQYNAWIRFSNADPSGDAKPDLEVDQRGMAVKIMGVANSPTGNQDLVMMDSEAFFSKDGDNYVPMTKALMDGKLATLAFFATHPHQAHVLLASRHKITSPLSTTFYSSVPYKLGARYATRFMMQACDKNNVFPDLPDSASASPNYLRERLAATLQKQDACFDFFLQPNIDPQDNPIEDPTQIWDHSINKFVWVGRLTLPKQDDELSSSQMNFCENISMDPWRTPSDTRPLGQINRIRRYAYPRISQFRHQANKRQRLEPRDLAPCANPSTADLCQAPVRQ